MNKVEVRNIVIDLQLMYVVLLSFNENYLSKKCQVPSAGIDTTLALLLEEVNTKDIGEEQLIVLDGCLGFCYGFCDSCRKKFDELAASKNDKWMKVVVKKCGKKWGDMVEVEQQLYKDLDNARQVLDKIGERIDSLKGSSSLTRRTV